jgi:uncharacterized protein (TIGR04255 family)
MKIPRKLAKEPIAEVVTEMRFASAVSAKTSVMPGLIFGRFAPDYPEIQQNPVSAMGMLQDAGDSEQFAFLPTHRFIGSQGMIVLTPRSVLLHTVNARYPGWGEFRSRAQEVFSFVCDTQAFGAIDRVSIRYTNILNVDSAEDSLAYTTAVVSLAGQQIKKERVHLRVEFNRENLTGIVQLGARVEPLANLGLKPGSLLDVDVIANGPFENLQAALASLDTAHDYEKELFFSLVEQEHLETYEPQY